MTSSMDYFSSRLNDRDLPAMTTFVSSHAAGPTADIVTVIIHITGFPALGTFGALGNRWLLSIELLERVENIRLLMRWCGWGWCGLRGGRRACGYGIAVLGGWIGCCAPQDVRPRPPSICCRTS